MDNNKKRNLADCALNEMYIKMAQRICEDRSEADQNDPYGYKRADAIRDERDHEFLTQFEALEKASWDDIAAAHNAEIIANVIDNEIVQEIIQEATSLPYFDIGGDVGALPGTTEEKTIAISELADFEDVSLRFIDTTEESKQAQNIQLGSTFFDSATGEAKTWNGDEWVPVQMMGSTLDFVGEKLPGQVVDDFIPTVHLDHVPNPHDVITVTDNGRWLHDQIKSGAISISFSADESMIEYDGGYIVNDFDLTSISLTTTEEDPKDAYDRAMSLLGDD